ncbi:MAG: Ig-like domain-containing protein [candidate division Zixibacteria bacterium]|nr:Ig-like domain-containing protein [candidate division Zixibacteria bacterium]
MNSRKQQHLVFLALFLIFALAGCAKIELPPGGPIDRTGPFILVTVPSPDSTRVPRDNLISIQFSEEVNRKSAEAATFISPRVKEGIKYNWHGRTMNMVMPDSFIPNTTYIVNLGTTLVDFRNNKMAKSFQFAFSTGENIAEGRIIGMVFQQNKPAAGITIALYDSLFLTNGKSFDSIYPLYLTQSGDSGNYGLQYLPNGKYMLLAFEDKNKNQLFDYSDEAYGLPDRLARISPEFPMPDINFSIVKGDTSSISILSASLTSDYLIRVRFSKTIPGVIFKKDPTKIFLLPEGNNQPVLNPAAILENEDDTVSSYNLQFNGLNDGNYRLRLESNIFDHNDSSGFIESGTFSIKLDTDKTPPAIMSVSHSEKIIFPNDSIIVIQFSEPIGKPQYTDSLITITTADSTILPINLRWPDDFRAKISISTLEWGEEYKISVCLRNLCDLYGNRGGDSTIIFTFKTYSQDSLGNISGRVGYNPGFDTTGIPYLLLNRMDDKRPFIQTISNGRFNFQLPPGKYILSGFIDRNGNGQYDKGTLLPFGFAETMGIYPDTVKVRARFETFIVSNPLRVGVPRVLELHVDFWHWRSFHREVPPACSCRS